VFFPYKHGGRDLWPHGAPAHDMSPRMRGPFSPVPLRFTPTFLCVLSQLVPDEATPVTLFPLFFFSLPLLCWKGYSCLRPSFHLCCCFDLARLCVIQVLLTEVVVLNLWYWASESF